MRSYNDGCGIAQGLDLIGERWALLVVRELLLGPKRFVDLRAGLPGVSPNVLSQRLRELEHTGVIRRGKLPPPAGSRVYELTEWGRELEDVIVALGRWANRSPTARPDAPMGTDSVLIALEVLFDPGAAREVNASYQLRLGEERFRVEIADGELEIARGDAERPDATIDSDPETLRAVLWHGRRLNQARRSGELTVEGNVRAAERFLRLFPAPEGAATRAR